MENKLKRLLQVLLVKDTKLKQTEQIIVLRSSNQVMDKKSHILER